MLRNLKFAAIEKEIPRKTDGKLLAMQNIKSWEYFGTLSLILFFKNPPLRNFVLNVIT